MLDMTLTREFWLDAKERIVRTFVQTFTATLPLQVAAEKIVSGDFQNLKVLGIQAGIAAVAAALSAATSLFFVKKENTISPASAVLVTDTVPKSELIDVNDPAVIAAYLDELDTLEVDESLLPDEHTTAIEEKG